MTTTGPTTPAPPIVPVCRRDAYTIGLEEYDGHCFAHCLVHKALTPSTWRQLQADWTRVTELQGRDIFALAMKPHEDDPAKHRKFVSRFGFKPHTPFRCADGLTRTIYRRKAQHG